MNRRPFWQRSRIAYNAPVFAGLIDCAGPVLRLVAVAGVCATVCALVCWLKVICSHLSAAGFSTSKLLVKYLPHLWAWSRQDHSAEFSAQCNQRKFEPVHSAENCAQCQTGFFRYDSPIQYWLRQPAENSVRWIVPIDTMSSVSEMISPRL